ncbi:MAG: alpha/beta hydrolase [Firmicutes bacterium]|nr:alpha/beta hydrolase [Bacillota bacterium]
MIRVKKIRIPELPTREPRRLYVYLPHDYSSSEERYPVLYMFDGHNVFYDAHATYGKSWGMKEYLTRTRLPLMVVAVECNPEGTRRLNEYAPWDRDIPRLGHLEGLGKVTMNWITGPLKQWVDRTYRTLPDREHTYIAGSSMGGLMSLYAVTAYNEVFSRAAALSPSIHAGGRHLHELIRSAGLQPTTRVYMDVGTEEISHSEYAVLAGLFTCAAELVRSGAEVAARLVPGAAHNEAAWERRIPVFMDYLLGPDGGNEAEITN